MSGYRDDLAYIHDVGHGAFARDSAPALLAILGAHGVEPGERVVDLGCGSGIWAAELLRRGYRVVGIDQSPAMLKIARRRARGARFVRGSFFNVPLPACAAVTALGECFNYVFDRRNNLRALETLFRRIHRALRPGGVLIFDVATPGRGGGPGKRHKNVKGDDWAILLETEEDARERTLTRRIVAFRRVGTLFRRSEEVHRLRLYPPRHVLRALGMAGFRARTIRSYGSTTLPHGWIAFVARAATPRPSR